jgi:glucoside 3-dehydrogenase (cytochrome c) hitch-hiker subunit
MRHTGLNRRDALRTIALGGIGAATAASWVQNLSALARVEANHLHVAVAATQATTRWAPKVLNAHQHETVATLVELIIPQTNTPGAKAALVDRFVDSLLEAAQRPDRARFVSGLAWLDRRSRALYASDFVTAGPARQAELLTRLSAEASAEERAGVEFFTAIKSMTITGYYTSEIGLRDELGDDGQMFLAAYEGCTHPEHQR